MDGRYGGFLYGSGAKYAGTGTDPLIRLDYGSVKLPSSTIHGTGIRRAIHGISGNKTTYGTSVGGSSYGASK